MVDTDENTGISDGKRLYLWKHFRIQTIIHGVVAVGFVVLGFVSLAKHDGRSNPPYFIGAFFVGIIVYYYNTVSISTILTHIISFIIAAVTGIPYGQKDNVIFDYNDDSSDEVDPVAETNKKLALAKVFSNVVGLIIHIYPVILSYKTASMFKVNLIKRRGLTGFRSSQMTNTVTNTEDGHMTGDRSDDTLMNDNSTNSVPPRSRPYVPIPLDVGARALPSAPPPSYEKGHIKKIDDISKSNPGSAEG